jgi:hypothetical protein
MKSYRLNTEIRGTQTQKILIVTHFLLTPETLKLSNSIRIRAKSEANGNFHHPLGFR